MRTIIQSATSIIRIQLKTELSDIQKLRFGFFQNGNAIYEVENTDDSVEIDEDMVAITVSADVCAAFSPGRFHIAIEATTATGRIVPACGVLAGRVLPNDFNKEG